jgi:polo-like kinase 1
MPIRYSKGKFLGKGGFARCYEVQHAETREIFAAKIVSKASIAKPRAHAKLRSEIAIHQSLDHERIVKFVDYFEDPDNVYIILEMCPNQTLNELLRRKPQKRMTEAEAMFYTYDLITALQYLHRCRVIHRDLKLGNLFLDANMRLRLGDFGLAAVLEHDGERKGTMCGTPNYIAPEILDGKNGHSFEVDVWSLGVVLYTMLIGRPPFETSDLKATYRRIRANDYSFPEHVPISDAARDLVRCILRTDPYARPSLEEF